MKILYITNKGNHINTVEKCCIYKATRNETYINGKNTVSENNI
jgi:hypothetical protein